MKRKSLLALIALLAIGLMVGCPTDDPGDNTTPTTTTPEDYGTNLVTEEAILAATGKGVTSVEKVTGGYEVTGTVTEHTPWYDPDNPPNPIPKDYRIQLEIQADPDDLEAYFSRANRYGITITFPNSTVKPIDEYTEGFQIYLENTKATANTAAWAGTWQHEYREEYEEIGGVGTMTINRDLTEPAESNEVGDYQHLVIVLKFEDTDEGEEYTFTISDVAVYGDSVESDAGRPAIHGDSALTDATYAQSATATALKVVATWTTDSSSYTYQWYSNTANSNTGGTILSTETTDTFTPPTTTLGTVYYYCVVTNPAAEKSVTTRAVKIEVNTDGVPTDPGLELWTPTAVAEPNGYVAFPDAAITGAGFYPTGGTIVKSGETYTVTAKTRLPTDGTGQTEITFTATDFAFKTGYYLSVTLPTDPTYKPIRLYSYMSAPTNYNSAVDVNAPADKFIGGKVDLHYTGTADANTQITLNIYWASDVTAGHDYVFTISVFKVAEESTEGPPPETPAIHETSKLTDATYELNATTVAELEVVATWTDNKANYTYQWYSNTTNSDTDGTIIGSATTEKFTPPVTAVGIVYYYCVVTYPTAGTSAKTRAVKITVTDEPILPPSFEVTRVHIYLQNSTSYAGPWNTQYDQDVFNGTFTDPATVTWASTALTGDDIGTYDQFIFDVHYPASAIGKDYEFTISDIYINIADGEDGEATKDTLTEAAILAGVRGGNAGNSYASQSSVVTKVSEGVYKVRMTVIQDYHWEDGALDAGITRLIITRADNTADVVSYGVKATLPVAFAED